MNINQDFTLKNIDGQYIIVPIRNVSADFNELIQISEIGVFLWDKLQQEMTEEELLKCILDEYEVEEDLAREDLQEFLDQLIEGGILVC